MIWDQSSGAFSVRRGPVFANIILADEINRAPAKVQSALLEAMEEGQVTIGEESHILPDPFLVLATQNPIEHEGTYSLPEAELDRFLLKLLVRYPSAADEVAILHRQFDSGAALAGGGGVSREKPAPLRPLLDNAARRTLRQAADAVVVDERITNYIVAIVASSRPAQGAAGAAATTVTVSGRGGTIREGLYRYISFGASPRASLALYRCARVQALFAGRSFVTPEDVKAAAYPVLRHRIALSYEAEADGLDTDEVISRLLSLVPVP
jgi:MoxR-like ATPase